MEEIIFMNTDPMIQSFIKGVMDWAANNILTVTILINVLTILKVYAIKTKNVVDDKIVSLLLYILSFKWLSITKKKVE